jgi:hypothetical protein
MANEMTGPTAPKSESQPTPPKPSGSFVNLYGPVIMAVLIMKLFGVAGGLVTFGVYYGLKPKTGSAIAAAVATVVGVGTALVLVVMLRGG